MNYPEAYYTSAADAGRDAGVDPSQIIRRVKAGEIPGAYQTDEGTYRIPVERLKELGYSVTGEGAQVIGPLSMDSRAERSPEPDEEDELYFFWHGKDVPSVRYEKSTKTFSVMGQFPLLNTPTKAQRLGSLLQAAGRWVGSTDK